MQAPHGFQSAPFNLTGLFQSSDPVYPILLDINVGNSQARRTLNFMKEGLYFNRIATKRVMFKLAFFNVDLQIFGVFLVEA
ncbi:hypothetical protein DUNSADRAFT_11569, partial [Dunaliella salina]